MSANANLTVHFLDGSRVSYRYPKQAGSDPASIAATVKRAIEAERLVLEVDGDLVVIPIRSVKYIVVSPTPAHLPPGILRGARLIS